MLTSVTFAASSQTYANDNNNKKKKETLSGTKRKTSISFTWYTTALFFLV